MRQTHINHGNDNESKVLKIISANYMIVYRTVKYDRKHWQALAISQRDCTEWCTYFSQGCTAIQEPWQGCKELINAYPCEHMHMTTHEKNAILHDIT